MPKPTKPHTRLIDAAVRVAGSTGIASLTVAAVAEEAGTSSALVHYHFDTKQALIVALAERVAKDRAGARSASLGEGRGLQTLEALWTALVKGSESGTERAITELTAAAAQDSKVASCLHAAAEATLGALAIRLPELIRELGSTLPVGREEAAAVTAAALDGLGAALVAGRPVHEVRNAFDAFWLVLIASGQGARRR